jgi:hypothetical protein
MNIICTDAYKEPEASLKDDENASYCFSVRYISNSKIYIIRAFRWASGELFVVFAERADYFMEDDFSSEEEAKKYIFEEFFKDFVKMPNDQFEKILLLI